MSRAEIIAKSSKIIRKWWVLPIYYLCVYFNFFTSLYNLIFNSACAHKIPENWMISSWEPVQPRFSTPQSPFIPETQLYFCTSLVAQMVKNWPAMQETWVRSQGWDNPLEKEMATHSSILAWRIPWTEDPGGLQSMGSQRVRHDWATFTWAIVPLWFQELVNALICSIYTDHVVFPSPATKRMEIYWRDPCQLEWMGTALRGYYLWRPLFQSTSMLLLFSLFFKLDFLWKIWPCHAMVPLNVCPRCKLFNQLSGACRPHRSSGGCSQLTAAPALPRSPSITLWNHTGWSPGFSLERKWLPECQMCHSHSSWWRARLSQGEEPPLQRPSPGSSPSFHRLRRTQAAQGPRQHRMRNRTLFRADAPTHLLCFLPLVFGKPV